MCQPPTLAHDRSLDELLTLLSNSGCRSLLWHLQRSSGEVYEVGTLANEIADHEERDSDQIRIQLTHSTLPQLEDSGIIKYDARSNTVRYQSHSQLEELLDVIAKSSSAAEIEP